MLVLLFSLVFSVGVADGPQSPDSCLKSVYASKPLGAEGFGAWLGKRKDCFEKVRASLYFGSEFGKVTAERQIQQLILIDEFSNRDPKVTVQLVGFEQPYTNLGFTVEIVDSLDVGGMLSMEELLVTGDGAAATVRRYVDGRTTSGYRRKFEKKNGEWNLGDYEDAWVH
ncbi:MAG: hypothetical protein HN348_24515 [Proteobacteria bacterium]|jgi:hypothetical protein|nr:hypothetical protein [Pseudomonadota bacterium]